MALAEIAEGRRLAAEADARLADLETEGSNHGALGAFLSEIRNHVAFHLRRAALLREMSAAFEQTESGLQHATHLYEGEGKMLGVSLMEVIEKHGRIMENPKLASVAEPFVAASRKIHASYADRIVGF